MFDFWRNKVIGGTNDIQFKLHLEILRPQDNSVICVFIPFQSKQPHGPTSFVRMSQHSISRKLVDINRAEAGTRKPHLIIAEVIDKMTLKSVFDAELMVHD